MTYHVLFYSNQARHCNAEMFGKSLDEDIRNPRPRFLVPASHVTEERTRRSSYSDLVVEILLVANTQLWDLLVSPLQDLAGVLKDLDPALARSVIAHAFQESPAHRANMCTGDGCIGGCLVVSTA